MSATIHPCARGWGRARPEVAGMLFPWDASSGQPVLIRIPQAPRPWAVPVFDDEAALRHLMAELHVADYTIKQVTDGAEFIDSVEESGGVVAGNPRRTAAGTVRWTWFTVSKEPTP